MYIIKFEDAYKCAVTVHQAKTISNIPTEARARAVLVANKEVTEHEGSQALTIPKGVYTDSEHTVLSKYVRLQVFVAALYKFGQDYPI